MPELKIDFKNLGPVRLMPLDTSSLFLPFGRPVADYLQGVVGSQNGARTLLRPGAVDFSPVIRWTESTARALRTTGFGELERDGLIEIAVVAAVAEPPEPGVADFLPQAGPSPLAPEGNPAKITTAMTPEAPAIAKPRIAALPLRPKMTLGAPPLRVKATPAPAPAPPLASKPAAQPLAAKPPVAPPTPPKPASAPSPRAPIAVKVTSPIITPPPAPKSPLITPPPRPVAPPAVAPTPRTAPVPPAPPVAPAMTAKAPTPVIRVGETAAKTSPAPSAEPGPQPPAKPGPVAVPRPAAPQPTARVSDSPEAAKVPVAQAPAPKLPAPAARGPVILPSVKPIVPPPASAPSAAPVSPAAARTAAQPAASAPAASTPAVPAPANTAATQPATKQGPPRTEAAKPAEPPAPRPTILDLLPARVLEPHLTIGDVENGSFLSRIPMAVKIGVAVLALMAVLYVVLGKSSGGRTAEDAAVAVGEQGWQNEQVSDVVGSRHGRVLQIYRPSVGMTDYQLRFTGQIESKALGWFFREVDTNNYYGMKIENLAPGKMAITHFAVVEGRESGYSQRPLAADSRPGSVYQVMIDVSGPRFTAYLGGDPVDFWTDNRLKAGAVGFMNEREERGATSSVRFSFPKGAK